MTEKAKNETSKILIPELCLVAMVGASSSGKSTFARKHFKPTEILSSDFFRGMISDDESNQAASSGAFELLHLAAAKRLAMGKLTVIDATSLKARDRDQIMKNAREQNVQAVAIVLNIPEKILQERNKNRTDHTIQPKVIQRHCIELKQSLKTLKKEGFRYIYVLNSEEEVNAAEVVREKMWTDRKDDHGPFDIIGDVHGCCDELESLLDKLGYTQIDGVYTHPAGRKAVFLGDFCDRGPRNTDVLRIVMGMVKNGSALAILGNHDAKLIKYLNGRNIQRTHGIDKTIEQIEAAGEEFKEQTKDFLGSLISHYVFDDGKLVVAHAGIKKDYIGRTSMTVRDFCLYGETTGETDEYGLPVTIDWTPDYKGKALIVYGHTAARGIRPVNNTLCIDTGCVYGGKLTAYRYPENEVVSVDALAEYYKPEKPLDAAVPEDGMDDIPSADDVLRRMNIVTNLMPSVDIGPSNAAAALEAMSRYAADPHWLIYLPPTMSPCETSSLDGYLEHPREAFEYFRSNGVKQVICEKKHMGSRAVIALCRNAETAEKRFSVTDGSRGIIYTRTGKRFFNDSETEKAILDHLDAVLTQTAFWEDFQTDWVCLDTELMPWSDKAQGLILTQYAPAGNAGKYGLRAAVDMLKMACGRENIVKDVDANTSGQNVDLEKVLLDYEEKVYDIDRYIKAYEEYCWTVKSIDDYRIAPFHILATEGNVYFDRTHIWHMNTIKKYMTNKDPIFMETPYIVVDVDSETSIENGIDWWTKITSEGGEGMVVKPMDYIAKNDGKLLQPAVKCRGREYLRIIYGPEYLESEHLLRLKKRSLGRKRQLALKEFALGHESLLRFVNKDPLRKVHECAFGVLALESEPVDPRL